MLRKTLPTIPLALLIILLSAVTSLARGKKPDPKEQKIGSTVKSSVPRQHLHWAEEEGIYPDAAAFEQRVKSDPNYVPGSLARQPAAGSSGLFSGIFVGNTTYDYQHNAGCHRMIQRSYDSRYVHVTWMVLKTENIADNNRQVNYSCYDWNTQSWTMNTDDYGGIAMIEAGERGGYTAMDVKTDGNAVVFHHSAVAEATNFSRIARFAIPGLGVFVADHLTSLPGAENIWARGAVARKVGENADVIHVGANDSNNNPGIATHAYWRCVWGGADWVWEGPVPMDSSMTNSHFLFANEDRVIFLFSKPLDYGSDQYDNNMVYYESTTGGADWISNGGPPTSWESGGGFNCTDYLETDPHRAFNNFSGGFTSDDVLRLICNCQRREDGTSYVYSELLYWDEGTAGSNANANVSGGAAEGYAGGTEEHFSTIALALWGMAGMGDGNDGGTGSFNSYISNPCLSIGDGSTTCGGGDNTDYLYVVYTQFGSEDPLDKEDASTLGWQNGNVWLSISDDGGYSWAPQQCITTVGGTVGGTPTRSPDCNVTTGDTCLSENWSSSAETVDDTLHVFYLGDLDAGGIPMGEGNWAINDMMYLPIVGGTDGDLCPVLAPVMSATITADADCEYHGDDADPVNNETLSIDNFGNTTLTYSIAISYQSGSGWLSIDGQQSIGITTILKGGAADEYDIEMDGTALANGLYQAEIQIDHDDPDKPDPYDLSIDFFRADTFICGTGLVMTTPLVALEVSNVGSVARANQTAGMFYYSECSAGCDPDDDSLYNPFYYGSLLIANKTLTSGSDTIVYRDFISNQTPYNPGFRALDYPTASFNAAKNESTVAVHQVTVDSTIGIDVQYSFPQNADSSEYVRVQYLVYIREDIPDYQYIIGAAVDIDAPGLAAEGLASENFGGYVEGYNLVYQHGTDTTRPAAFERVSNQYAAGITCLYHAPTKRMTVQNNRDHIYPWNGFRDGYIYNQLNATGNDIWADSADDIHSVIAFEEIIIGQDSPYACQMALVTSVAGVEDVAFDDYVYPYDGYVPDLIASTAQAWKKGFGIQYVALDGATTEVDASGSIPFSATGTHEDGISGGCCGCSFAVEPNPTPAAGTISIVDNADCTGYIDFDGVTVGVYTLTLTVEDLCAEQTDQVEFIVDVVQDCDCGTSWGDLNADGNVNPVDVVFMMNYVFRDIDARTQPPNCPLDAGDVTCDGYVDPVDMVCLMRHVYLGVNYMCPNPCE